MPQPIFPLDLLGDLYAHMEWADSQVWRAALACPAAQANTRLRDRLFHIHLTQRAFLQVWTRQPRERFHTLKFETLDALHGWTRPYYGQIVQFLGNLDATTLSEPVPVPGATMFAEQLKREASPTTLGETLFQVTSHSTYHRGQVNTTLRELGAEPPLVDYIAWLWLGRPAPGWPSA